MNPFNRNKQKAIVSGCHAPRARHLDLTAKRMGGKCMEVRIGEYPYFVGIDLHKRYSYVAVLNEIGEVVKREKFRTKN